MVIAAVVLSVRLGRRRHVGARQAAVVLLNSAVVLGTLSPSPPRRTCQPTAVYQTIAVTPVGPLRTSTGW